MKQQFIGQFHCKCSTSWWRDIVSASYCTTRLRFEVKDYRQVNEPAVKAAEEAKKGEAEDVLKKLLASGMTAEEILAKLQ